MNTLPPCPRFYNPRRFGGLPYMVAENRYGKHYRSAWIPACAGKDPR